MNERNRLKDMLNLVPASLRSTIPRATPTDPGKLLDHILYRHAKKEDSKPLDNVDFQAIVLYTSNLSYGNFIKKSDEEFVNYCTKNLPSLSRRNTAVSKRKYLLVMECIIYIPEICSCLPAIKNDNFLSDLKKFTNDPVIFKNEAKDIDALKKKSKGKKNSSILNDLNRIDRYPRAYLLYGDDVNRPDLPPLSTVTVRFPYKYDFSRCAVISVSSAK